jgi:hypothetical protein
MTYSSRRASLAALILSATVFAAPTFAATDTWRHPHRSGRWHGAAGVGTAYGHTRYQPWPYRPGQDRVDEGPGFYEGYGFNSHNTCFPGESMYDGC